MFLTRVEINYIGNDMDKRKKVKCNRCGYSWFTHKKGLPAHCANRKCNSPYWNKPRIYAKREKPELVK